MVEFGDLEIRFPVEFAIEGMPVSLQAKNPVNRDRWKRRVSDAARRARGEERWFYDAAVSATILIFPAADMQGDIDNVVKPILDALCGVVYGDDRQVDRILVRKFEPGRVRAFLAPSATLAEALEIQPPVVYIRLDDDVSRGSVTP